jgi:hypothetical protein
MSRLLIKTIAQVLLGAGWLFAGSVLAAAGKVDFVIGDTVAKSADGKERQLVKGADINAGDTIITRANGRAQLRMSDDSYFSFTPNTEFAVKEFTYGGRTDGNEKAIYGLLKGAMRTVSGLVGRVNKQAYSITTPTATVGIRGTGGEIQVTDDFTIVRGSSGTWVLQNQFGSLEVGAGQAAIATRTGAPTQTQQGPQVSAQQPNRQQRQRDTSETVSSADTVKDGQRINLPKAIQFVKSGDFGLAVEGIDLKGGSGQQTVPGGLNGTDVAVDNPQNPTLFGRGELVDNTVSIVGFSRGTAQVASGNERGAFVNPSTGQPEIYWGRFTNGTVTLARTENGIVTQTVSRTLTANQGVHAIYGIPTPIANMPTTGSATFTLFGHTNPTVFDGSFAPGSFTSSSANVNFGTRQIAFSGISTTFGSVTYMAQGTVPFTGSGINGNLGVFSPSGSIQGGQPCTGATCSAIINGGFGGAGATSFGVTYSIRRTDVAPTNSIDGAAVYKR